MHICDTFMAEGTGLPIALPPFAVDPAWWLRKFLDISGLSCDWKRIVRLFNTGSPRSRTRREALKSTLLHNVQLELNWPCRLTVALDFPDAVSPVAYTEALLEKLGYRTPEDALLAQKDLPDRLHYCHRYHPSQDEISKLSPDSDAEFLRSALILGLCGPNYYDPDRPVIWTETRLTRAVGLFLPGGFYED
jgi:hypothetical protein